MHETPVRFYAKWIDNLERISNLVSNRHLFRKLTSQLSQKATQNAKLAVQD